MPFNKAQIENVMIKKNREIILEEEWGLKAFFTPAPFFDNPNSGFYQTLGNLKSKDAKDFIEFIKQLDENPKYHFQNHYHKEILLRKAEDVLQKAVNENILTDKEADTLKNQIIVSRYPEVTRATLKTGLDYLYQGIFVKGFLSENENEIKARAIFEYLKEDQKNPLAKVLYLASKKSRSESDIEDVINILLEQEVKDKATWKQVISLLNNHITYKIREAVSNRIISDASLAEKVTKGGSLLKEWMGTPTSTGYRIFREPTYKTKLYEKISTAASQNSIPLAPLKEFTITPPKQSPITPRLPTSWQGEIKQHPNDRRLTETIATKDKLKFVVNHYTGKISTKGNNIETFKAMMETYKNSKPQGSIPRMYVNSEAAMTNMLEAFKVTFPNVSPKGKMQGGNQAEWNRALQAAGFADEFKPSEPVRPSYRRR